MHVLTNLVYLQVMAQEWVKAEPWQVRILPGNNEFSGREAIYHFSSHVPPSHFSLLAVFAVKQ